MSTVRVWFRRVGDGNASSWAKLLAALKNQSVTFLDDISPGDPGLLFFSEVTDRGVDELIADRGRTAGLIIAIVPCRADLSNGRLWRLMQAGADDVFVVEDCEDPAAAVSARLSRISEIEEVINSPVVKENLVGQSAAWRQAIRQVVELGRFSTNSILITGESGTGKELVAQLVHTLDARADKGKLVVLDCTTVSPELSGSEFFGHERGAFTNAMASRDGALALAHKGTLFLDEVGELPLALQAELLRAVQERSYKRVGSNTWQKSDFRLVCATNRNLREEEGKGNFRFDFYHRIACSHCHLPPLRERREDILPLARHFLREGLKDRDDLDFDSAVQEFLLTREYPGNIRELRHLVLRIAQRHVGPGPITAGAIPEEDRLGILEMFRRDWRDEEFQTAIRRALAGGAGLQEIRDQTVEAVIQIALNDAAGNVQRAAIKLGVTDRALQMRRAAQREAQQTQNRRVIVTEPLHSPMDREIRPASERSAP
jgi:transcriptional regulator with GAF, ATPase, and Fis domain